MRRVGALRDQLAPAAKASPSIIDVHTHFYDASKPWPGPHEALLYRTVLPADFMSVASPVGVTGTVVVAATNCCADITNAPADSLCKCFCDSCPVSESGNRKHKGALPRQWAVCRRARLPLHR